MCLPAPFVVELDADVVPRDALTEQDDLLAPGGGTRRVGDIHDLQLTLCLHTHTPEKELLLSHVTRRPYFLAVEPQTILPMKV
jgi:hypothetical protein